MAYTREQLQAMKPEELDALEQQLTDKVLRSRVKPGWGEKEWWKKEMKGDETVSPEEVSGRVAELQEQDLPPGSSAKVGDTTVPITRKYTGEENKMLATAGALTKEIEDLIGMVEEDASIWNKRNKSEGLAGDAKALWATSQGTGSLPFGGMQERGQRFAMLRKSTGERILRLRSGAQINENEYKRFMDLLPKVWRKDKVDLEALNNFKQEFKSIEGRIQSGALYDKQSKSFIVPPQQPTQQQAPQPQQEVQPQPAQEGFYTVGQIITLPDGRKMKVIGGDMNDPDVEEAK